MIEFYCLTNRIAVYEGNIPLAKEIIRALTVGNLLGYNIRAHEKHPITLETLGEDHVEFNFKGNSFNKRFERKAPATELLDEVVRAAGFFDPRTEQFYF